MFESRDSTHPGYSSHATSPLTLPSHFYHGATELAISAQESVKTTLNSCA